MYSVKLRSGEFFQDELTNFFSNNSKCKIISFVNPFSMRMLKLVGLREGIDSFYSDGAWLCFLYRIFNEKVVRASFDFSSIADNVFRYCEDNSLSIGFVGAKKYELNLTVHYLKERYPEINIVLNMDGYFSSDSVVLNELSIHKPDILVIGMGTPMQEELSLKVKSSNESSRMLIFTCGGFLTQTSMFDGKDYYHPLINLLGLRWLQRAFLHKHVRKRLLIDYPKFTVGYICSNLKMKLRSFQRT